MFFRIYSSFPYQRPTTELLSPEFSSGISPTEKNTDHRTPLHSAAQKGNQDVVEVLLKHSSNNLVNLTDVNGMTALHFAARGGHFQICQLLLQHNADCSIISASGHTAYQLAPDSIKRLFMPDPSGILPTSANLSGQQSPRPSSALPGAKNISIAR